MFFRESGFVDNLNSRERTCTSKRINRLRLSAPRKCSMWRNRWKQAEAYENSCSSLEKIFDDHIIRRFYFSATKDVNIRYDQSKLISDLKTAIFSSRHATQTLESIEKRFLNRTQKAHSSELLVSAQSLSRLRRQRGGIVDPRLSLPILKRLDELVDTFDRTDVIQLIQLMSLSVNRRKVLLGDCSAASIDAMCENIVSKCCQRLHRKLEDLPISSLSVLVSSVSRRRSVVTEGFFREVSLAVTSHIDLCITRKETPASAIIREDLQRALPYIWIAFKQIQYEPEPHFSDSSLKLFSLFLEKVPFTYLTLFVEGLAGNPNKEILIDFRFRNILDYCEESLSASPDDFLIADMCRLFSSQLGIRSLDMSIMTLLEGSVSTRSSSEWTVHVLVEIAEILSRSNLSECRQLCIRFESEFRKQSATIPPSYSSQIFRYLLASDLNAEVKEFAKSLVMKHMKRLTPTELIPIIQSVDSLESIQRKGYSAVSGNACRQLKKFLSSLKEEDTRIFKRLCQTS